MDTVLFRDVVERYHVSQVEALRWVVRQCLRNPAGSLIGIAVLIAVGGIVYAFMRLKPAVLLPKDQSPEAHGFERVLEHKYYVDEIYDRTVVKPVVGISSRILWKGMDAGLIDGLLVNGSGYLMRGTVAARGRRVRPRLVMPARPVAAFVGLSAGQHDVAAL